VRFAKDSTSRPEPTVFRRQLRATTGLRSEEAIGHACGILGVHPFSDGLITKRSSGQQIECQQGRVHLSGRGRARTLVSSRTVAGVHPLLRVSASQPFPGAAVIKVRSPHWPLGIRDLLRGMDEEEAPGLVGPEVVDSQRVGV
jgi:hypothetical protein